MIVVAILGILLSLGTVRFATLLRKSREGTTKGNLGTIRSALAVYYSNMTTQYPAELAVLTVGNSYLNSFPKSNPEPYHESSAAIVEGTGRTATDDTGGWGYSNDSGDLTNFGIVWVNCTHTDSKNEFWTRY